MLTHLVAGKNRIHLVVAVDCLIHALLHDARHIAGEQLIPCRTPDDFQHIPVCAAENAFQFLDDFAVAANGSIEPLQVAVDHQDEVVEVLARGDIDGAEHFRLVAFTVADEAPDFAAIVCFEAAMLEVLGKTGQVDGGHGGQAHGCGWARPKLRHATRVGVRTQAPACSQFAPEILHLVLAETTLQEGASIDTWGGMRLNIDNVSTEVRITIAEEVVEPHFHHRRRRCIGGDMAADARSRIKCLQYHRHGVPAVDILDPLLHVDIARICRL